MSDDQIPQGLIADVGNGAGPAAELLLEAEDAFPDQIEIETAPFWGEDLEELYYHFDVTYDPDAGERTRRERLWDLLQSEDRSRTYQFTVPVPESSHLHPDNPDHEPETLPDLARRKFLKGMGIGAAISVAGTGTAVWHDRETRTPYESARHQARQLVADVRHAREHGTDRSKLYLGDPNRLTYAMDAADGDWLGPAPPEAVGGVLAEGEITVELVYLDEPMDTEEFMTRAGTEIFDVLTAAYEYADSHHLPEDARGHRPPAEDTPFGVVYRYVQGMWEQIARARRRGTDYVDAQVDNLDPEILHEAGTMLAREMDRVGGDAVDVDYSIRREPLPRGMSQEQRRSELFPDYAQDPHTFPLFVTTRELPGDYSGWGAPRQAVAELPRPLLLEEGDLTRTPHGRGFVDLILMEAGHGVYRLPHTAARDDAMTYNDEFAMRHWVGGEVMGYGPITEAYVQRYVDGETRSTDDGLMLRPADIPADRADDLYRHNLSRHIDDMMDFPLTAWDAAFDRDAERFTLSRDEDRGTVTVEGHTPQYIAEIGYETG